MKFKNRMRYHLKKGGTWCVYDTYENENPNVEDKAHDVFCSSDWPWIYYPEGFLGCYHVGKPIYIRNPEKYADMFEPYYTKEEREEAKRLRRQYAGLAMSGTINALMSEAETASLAEKALNAANIWSHYEKLLFFRGLPSLYGSWSAIEHRRLA